LSQTVPYDDAKVGAAIAVQSFGDFQNFNPHLHVLATGGCFYSDAAFIHKAVDYSNLCFCAFLWPYQFCMINTMKLAPSFNIFLAGSDQSTGTAHCAFRTFRAA
jgi:hypothetical protein